LSGCKVHVSLARPGRPFLPSDCVFGVEWWFVRERRPAVRETIKLAADAPQQTPGDAIGRVASGP
jgi:hypothetical protein